MKIIKHALVTIGTITIFLTATAFAADNSSQIPINLLDAINCKLDVTTYNGFAINIAINEEITDKYGWKKLPSNSSMIIQYQLPTPIKVADSYSTRVIGFTSNAIVAILDLPDPEVIAVKEGVKNIINPEISAALDGGFRRFMGQLVLIDKVEPPQDSKFGARISIAREISNFRPLPGKTLYGCSYQMTVLDENGNPL